MTGFTKTGRNTVRVISSGAMVHHIEETFTKTI
jgi:hypothetical protein